MKNNVSKVFLLCLSFVLTVTLFTPVRVMAVPSVSSEETVRLNIAVNDPDSFKNCDIVDPIVNRDDIMGIVSIMVDSDTLETSKSYYLSCDGVVDVFEDHYAQMDLIPVDPNYAAYQYNLKQIGLESVWNTTKGSTSVIVAVIDTGVDPVGTLSDFGTGTILKGASVLTNNNGYQSVYIDSYVGQYSYDGGSHGTAVAMTIAAAMNSKSITGVSPNVKILPIKVFRNEATLNENVFAYNQDVAKGIIIAVDLGADIINLSLGSEYTDYGLEMAVQYAVKRGVIVVAASGNNSNHEGLNDCILCSPYDGDITYPAHLNEVISVGSISKANLLSNFSSYSGASLELVAYGEDIWLPWRKENKFKLLDGTSFSSPTVAGVLALLVSVYPSLTALQARAALLQGTTDITTYGVGPDEKTGHGLVNAAGAFRVGAEIVAKDDHDDTYAKATRLEFSTPYSSSISYTGDRDLFCITTYRTENLRFDVSSNQPMQFYTQLYQLDENGALTAVTSAAIPWILMTNRTAGTYCAAVSETNGRKNTDGGQYTVEFTSDILVTSPQITVINNSGSLRDGETSFLPVNLNVQDSYKHTVSITKDGQPYTPVGNTLSEDGDYVVTVDDIKNDPVAFRFKIRAGINMSGFMDGRLYNTDITIRFSADSATINGQPLISGTIITEDGTYVLELVLGDQTYHASFSIDQTRPLISGLYYNNFFKTKPITFNEGTALMDGRPFTNGDIVSTLGQHWIKVTDEAGNYTELLFFIIDKVSVGNITTVPSPSSITFNINSGNADYYKIYAEDPDTGNLQFIAQFTGVSYKVTGLADLNKTYLFQLEGCKKNDDDILCTSTGTISAKTMLDLVQFEGKQLNYKTISMSWSAAELATGYDIIVDGKVFASTTEQSYTLVLNDPVGSYTNWTINVAATAVVEGEKIQGRWNISSSRSYSAENKPPVNLKIEWQEDESYRISWDPVSGANKYSVFGFDKNNARLFNVKVTDTHYDTYVWPGNQDMEIYVYSITAFSNGYELTSYSPAISKIFTHPGQPVLTGTASGADALTLSWTGDSLNSGYTVYELNKTTMKYDVVVDNTTAKSVTLAGKNIGELSTYKVKAFRIEGGTRLYGPYSNAVALTPTPLTVTGFLVASIGADKVQLNWDRQSGVTHYGIYTSASTTGTFVLKETLAANSTGWISGLTFNTTTYFKIKPIVVTASQSIEGPLSSPIAAKTTLEIAADFNASSIGYTSNILSWKSVPLASGYEVYGSTGTTDPATLLATVTSTSFTHSALLTNTKYNYKVRAYRLVGTTKIYGAFTLVKSSSPIPATAQPIVLSDGYNGLKVSWPAIAGANGYEVSYRKVGTQTWTLMPLSTLTSVIISGLITNQTYEVSVRAYRLVGTLKVFGSASNSVSAKPIPSSPIPNGTIVDYRSIKITWSAIAGADGYQITHLNPGTGNYELLSEVSVLEFTESGLVSGSSNVYKVIAYRLVDGIKVLSNASSAVTLIPIPSIVTGLKTGNLKYTELTLSWDAVTGASGYEISRASTSAGNYTLVASVEKQLTYTNSGLAFNTAYYYKVRAYTTVGDTKVFGNASTYVTAKTTLETVLNLSSTYTSYNANKIQWSAVNGATGYEIYRSIGTSTTYSLLTTTTAISYSNTSLLTNTRYNYKIRAYRLVGTVKVYGAFGPIVSSTPLPSSPVVTVTSSSYNSLKVTWPVVPGANGYEVSYSTSETGIYTKLALVTTNSASIINLLTNTATFVKVRAYRTVNYVKIYGSYSSLASATPIPSMPVLTAVSLGYDSLKISWAAITGATGYELYKFNPTSSSYELKVDTALLTYTDSGLVTGADTSYKVKAYRLVGTTRVYSLESAVITSKAVPSIVTGLKTLLPKVTEISLTWTTVSGATGYEISRSSTLTGTYSVIGTVEGKTSYTNTGLAFNTSYYYKVRPYTTIKDIKVYGLSTVAVSGKTALESVLGQTASYTSYSSNLISWSTVTGATGYEIYRSIGTSTYYTLLRTQTTLSYVNTGLYTNYRYNYKIRAYKLVGTVKVYGAFSSIVSATPLPWAPTATVTSSGYNSLKVTWPVVAGANGYEVSYSTSETGIYTKLALVTTNSASIINLLTNTTYFIKVRAYRTVNSVKIYGAPSTIVSGKPIPSTPVMTLVSEGFNRIKITWLAIPGATGYELYTVNPTTHNLDLLSDNALLTYTHTDLVTGQPSEYMVKAYRLMGVTKIYSPESQIKSVTPLPALVTGLRLAMPSVTSLKLAWTAVEGATGYEVFKSSTLAGTYVLIGTVVSATEFNVTGLTFNTITYYKVRAYTTVNDIKVYGTSTLGLTGKTMPSTVSLSVNNTSTTSNTLSWPAIEGATGYEIYYSSGTTTTYTLLKSLTTTSFLHTPLVFNTQYNYKVRAYKLIGTVKYYGAYSTLTSIKTAVSAPAAIHNFTHDSIGLTWNVVLGASGYECSIATALTGPYTVTTQTSVSKTFEALTTGTTYYIKLRSYRLISTTKVYGPYSSIIMITPSLTVPTLQLSGLSSTSASLTWNAVPGASDYEVRIKSDALGSEWIVESVSELTTTFDDLDMAAHYTVEVRALKKINEVPVYSEYSGQIIFSYSDTQ